MKKTYQTPHAELTVFRPMEALAGAVIWDNLLGGQYDSQASTGATALSGDIAIKI